MSRRTHKKSRHGCAQCKRRHMRCDETRPRCLNCEKAEVQCSFDEENEPQFVFYDGQQPAASLHAPPTYSSSPTLSGVGNRPLEDQSDPSSANVSHFILTQNLSSLELVPFDISEVSMAIPMSTYTRYAERSPYLLHQVLAASALHLSVTSQDNQERKAYYLQAQGLHARSLVLFNESNVIASPDRDTCVPVYLYSCLLSVYLLCETLQHRISTLQQFLDNFTRCLLVYQGVAIVMSQTEEMLDDSELGPQVRSVRGTLGSMECRGPECADVWKLLAVSSLRGEQLEACKLLLQRLEQIFRAQRRLPANGCPIPYVTLAWPAFVSNSFVSLLANCQPEALIIVAHFGILLHQGRDLWPFGSGGRRLIQLVADSLGPSWAVWMRGPLSALAAI